MARASTGRLTRARRGIGRWLVGLPPPLLLMTLYATFIGLGTVALMLPGFSTEGITLSEALFTATSAVTVTGLVVVDTGSAFTVWGQAVVALLIQLGGLGLMTFAVLVLSALGQRVGYAQQLILRDDLDRTSVGDLLRLVRVIGLVVLVCEVVGVALLAIVLVPDEGWAAGLWSAVFHSISAFNNAGFALYPDSLSRYAASPLVNLTVPGLFILGGLGYAVISDALSGRGWRSWSLHTKLMLSGTAVLIVVSVLGYAALEWTNPGTLGERPLAEKLWVSWFQGVTTRTAGFNTDDTGAMTDATALMFMVLMFIGGGSTSTAGGIKVTTALVLVLATVAFFKRRQELVAFGRSIGLDQVLKVMALVTVGILFVVLSTFALLVTQEGEFVVLAFEAVSAFGTVGLSMGATGELDGFGRAVIVTVMFFGRVGPLTLGFFIATRMPPRVRYPERQVYFG